MGVDHGETEDGRWWQEEGASTLSGPSLEDQESAAFNSYGSL